MHPACSAIGLGLLMLDNRLKYETHGHMKNKYNEPHNEAAKILYYVDHKAKKANDPSHIMDSHYKCFFRPNH